MSTFFKQKRLSETFGDVNTGMQPCELDHEGFEFLRGHPRPQESVVKSIQHNVKIMYSYHLFPVIWCI